MRRWFDAWNRTDLDAFADLFDADAVLITDPSWMEAGPFEGRAAIRAWFEGLKESWDDRDTVALRELVEVGDKVVARLDWQVRGRASGIEMELDATSINTFKGARISAAVVLRPRESPRSPGALGVSSFASRRSPVRARHASPASSAPGAYDPARTRPRHRRKAPARKRRYHPAVGWFRGLADKKGERMLQARENERIRACRALRVALAFATLVVLLAGPAATPAGAIFRAFSSSSPWNVTAVPTAPSNPYAGGFADSPGFAMKLSGTPDNITHGSPVFFAAPGDPTAPVSITQPDWTPEGETKWDGKPVPVPIGVAPAPGTDGHLTIVSAAKDVAWEFFGCTQAGSMGYVTKVIVQWDLTGPGYSTEWDNTSARGSGLPLISTSLRPDEALRGIQHALGITVPRVSADYIFPAAHSDGRQGPGAIKYGMRSCCGLTTPCRRTRASESRT